MTVPTSTKLWQSLETLTAPDLNTIGTDWVAYLSDRNDGTEAWEICNVTATTSNVMKITGNQTLTEVSIANTATDGDPILTWKLGTTVQFALGVDDGSSDAFKGGTTAIGTATWLSVSSGATTVALQASGTDGVVVNANGIVTHPNQPCFGATAVTNTANVTGDGTSHTVEWDAERFDLNADFDLVNFRFTAPITGKYQLNVSVLLVGITTSHTAATLDIITSTRTYRHRQTLDSPGIEFSFIPLAHIVDMDVNDTVTVVITVSGATKVVELFSDSTFTHNYFSGFLMA